MCWNATVSIQTFVLSCAAIMVAWWLGMYSHVFLLFYFAVAVMQLDEFFLWRNLKDKTWNRVFTRGAVLILLLQPLVAMHILHNTDLLHYVFYPLYAVFLVVTTAFMRNHMQTVQRGGHLVWGFFESKQKHSVAHSVWLLLYYGLLFTPFFIEGWYHALGIGIATLLLSLYVYGSLYPSLWCWSLNAFSIYVLVYAAYQSLG